MNFANIDFADRSAVERLLDEAGKEAKQAWEMAARAAEALPKTTSTAPHRQDIAPLIELIGILTTRAAETNLNALKSHAEMVTAILAQASDAYRLFFEAVNSSHGGGPANVQQALVQFEGQNSPQAKLTATERTRADSIYDGLQLAMEQASKQFAESERASRVLEEEERKKAEAKKTASKAGNPTGRRRAAS